MAAIKVARECVAEIVVVRVAAAAAIVEAEVAYKAKEKNRQFRKVVEMHQNNH